MDELSSAPPSIRALAEWLAERGTPLVLHSFHSHNNQLLKAESPQGTFEVLADRGQWFVRLAPAHSDEYFDSAVWEACLSGKEVSLEVDPLEVQVAFLQDLLTTGATDTCSTECLTEARITRVYRSLGWDPP